MTNHPNRSRRHGVPGKNPDPEEVKRARLESGRTQEQCAHLIYATLRAWQDWESGQRRMHPGLWELFRIKGMEPDLWELLLIKKERGTRT